MKLEREGANWTSKVQSKQQKKIISISIFNYYGNEGNVYLNLKIPTVSYKSPPSYHFNSTLSLRFAREYILLLSYWETYPK